MTSKEMVEATTAYFDKDLKTGWLLFRRRRLLTPSSETATKGYLLSLIHPSG
jgi:hypothetical protein